MEDSPTPAAPKVFISYRREETAGHAGRLYDALAARFGERKVFMDVDLAPGTDFVDRITEAVGACDVLLVVMGPRWARGSDGKGQPRLADPDDFVRLEVETALRRPDVTVIPLLVAGARMPDPDELPDGVRELSRRNALELSDQRWRYDVGRLERTLIGIVEGLPKAGEQAVPATTPKQPSPTTPAARPRRALLGVILAALALGVVVAALAIAGVFSGQDQAGESGGGGSSQQITSEDAGRAVGNYKTVYEAKDLDGLESLLDPNVVFKRGSKVELRGTSQVLDRYRLEFRRLGDKKSTFEWEEAFANAGENDAEASGPYVISVGGAVKDTGRFGLRLRSVGSHRLITELCFDCPDLRPGGPIGSSS